MRVRFTLGRMIFGGFFLYNGINHFLNYKTYAQYAASKKVPTPEAAVLGTGALLTAGGASLILGVRPRLGAAAIMTFLGGVSPMMHDFWNDPTPEARQANQVNFGKNAALLAAALAIAGAEERSEIRRAKQNAKELEKLRAKEFERVRAEEESKAREREREEMQKDRKKEQKRERESERLFRKAAREWKGYNRRKAA